MDSQYETKPHTLLKRKTEDFFEEQMERGNFEALDDKRQCVPSAPTPSSNVLDRIEQMYGNWEESFTWSGEISPEEWEKIEKYQLSRGLR